jgi:putative copper export protein
MSHVKSILLVAVVIGLAVSTVDATTGHFASQVGSVLLKGVAAGLLVLGLGFASQCLLSHSVEEQNDRN